MLKNNFEKRVSLENWTKNHKTGQFEQVTKIKPATFMKGKAHIQVFDKDGNIEQEAVTENVICDSVNRHFSAKLLHMLTCSNSSNNNNYQLFERLILCNYTGVEDATNIIPHDIIKYPTIGWAVKSYDYAGTDLLRGDRNVSESTLYEGATPNVGEIKLVFDWNTDQANGTFQSLFWYPGISNGSDENDFTIWNNQMLLFYANDAFYTTQIVATGSFHKTGMFYIAGANYSSGPYDLIFIPREILDNDQLGSSTVNTVISGTFYGSGIDGDDLYVWDTANLYKYDLNYNLQNTYSLDFSTYGYKNGGIIVNGKLYTLKYIDATTWNLYEFSLIGNLLNTYNIYDAAYASAPAPTAYCTLYSDAENNIRFIIDNATDDFEYCVSTSGTILSHYRHKFGGSQTTGLFCYDKFTGQYYCSVGSDYFGKAYFSPYPSAHTLLASPVTKTSANTMKITYTFSFDLTAL